MRFEAASSVKQFVRNRFKNQCVVCGTDKATDVAHLFEDATEREATSDRLILLCPNDNQAQDRTHGRNAPSLPRDLKPHVLLTGARNDYWGGNYSSGYGKARIAAYLHEKEGAYSDAVECLTEAISAARPLRWGDWLAATIREAERVSILHPVGMARRWLFLDRIALALFDYARWPEAYDVVAAAIELRDKVTTDFYNPQALKFDKQAAFRRESLIKGSVAKLDEGKTIDNLLQQLEEEAAGLLKLGRFDSVVTHLDVARNLAAARGDWEGSHRFAERVMDIRSKISHKWALIEHLVGEAEYFIHRRDRKRAIYYAGEALALFSKHPAVLEPVLQNSPKSLNLRERIFRMGITNSELLAHNVPIAPDIVEVPLALNPISLRAAVQNILDNGGH